MLIESDDRETGRWKRTMSLAANPHSTDLRSSHVTDCCFVELAMRDVEVLFISLFRRFIVVSFRQLAMDSDSPERRFSRRQFLTSSAAVGVSPFGRLQTPPITNASSKNAWPMTGGASPQTNANPSSSPIEQAPTVKWSYTATEDVYAPIVVDGRVFFTAEDKHLYALDAATGRELWRTSFEAGLGGTPAYSNDALLVCDNTDTVYRMQPGTGATVWKFALRSPSTVYGAGYSPPSPIIANGRVYIPTKSELYALDIETGDPRWIRRPGPTGGSLLTHPAVSAGRAVVGEWTSGPSASDAENLGLYAYDAETGKLLWENSPRTADESIDRIQDPPTLTPEAVYVTSEGNEVHRVDAATGEIVWTHALSEEGSGGPSAPTVTDSTAYLSIEDGIRALALDTGEPRWQSGNRNVWGLRPPADSSQIYTSVGTELWALDGASGKRRWTYRDVYGSIVVAGGTLYVADNRSVTALEVLGPEEPRGRQAGAKANEALISLGIGAAIVFGNLYAIWRARRSERK